MLDAIAAAIAAAIVVVAAIVAAAGAVVAALNTFLLNVFAASPMANKSVEQSPFLFLLYFLVPDLERLLRLRLSRLPPQPQQVRVRAQCPEEEEDAGHHPGSDGSHPVGVGSPPVRVMWRKRKTEI